MIDRLLDTVDGIRHGRLVLGPVVIVGRRQEIAREDAAYQFGRLSAGTVDSVALTAPSRRHLQSR